MKKHMKYVLITLFIVIYCLVCVPFELIAGNGWLFFARDINSISTKYYYDLESVKYYSDNRVSASIKIGNSKEGQTLLTEINCSGRLFRIIQPPSVDMTGWLEYLQNKIVKKSQKNQYIVSGWLEIPPDSEINILRRQLCNYPKKDWN